MTAPAAAQISAIQAEMSTLQSQLNALSGRARSSATATASTTSTATSAASFASTLAAATPTTTAGTGAVASGATGVASVPSGTAVTGADVVSDAKRYLGIPYVWGSESLQGLDCSGLVQKTFRDLGISLPRVAAAQQKVGTPVASLADAQPGDLLFFGKPAHHVAIYAGNNQLIEAPTAGENVHIKEVYEQPTTISRIVSPGTSDPTSALTTATGTGLSSAQLSAAGVNPAVAKYSDQFAAAEQRYNLPSGLLAAVAQQESGGNTSAVSAAGAQGLMQLMPGTARSHGVDAFDPTQAIGAAASILHANLRQFGTVPLALAAYNAGAGAVARYGGIPPYTETQNYVRRITATLAAGG